MARNQTNSNDKLVESNAIARARLSPPADSVWEERIIAQVAAFNRIDTSSFPDTAFMVGQLTEKYLNRRELLKIEKAAENLLATSLTVYRENGFRKYSVFDYIDFDCGIITAKLNQSLKPHYLELKKQFAVRSLPEFKLLSSVYSQQIYRFLNSWAHLPEVTRPIQELYHATNPPQSTFGVYKNFKVRVLDVAHKEINDKTSLKYSWEPIKSGKSVIEIRFIFKHQEEGK